MKKLLLLGGSAQQVIAIETAKKMGLYTVLCDYLPDNPGKYHADKFYQTSTTDFDAVLKIAEKEAVDGVIAYASDPAAPTAAYVAEKLNLPGGSPFESVDILCHKDKYRKFLTEHNFCTPKAKGYDNKLDAVHDLEDGYFHFPVLIKPVDSSGSRGVTRMDFPIKAEQAIDYALSFSRAERIIIEEYVEKLGYQIAGDGLSIDGKLVFRCFGNDHFDPKCENPFVPISASFPYNMPDEVQEKIHAEIQRLLSLLHMGSTTYNFDMRIDEDYNVYLMEVGPRSGGNYIPDVIKYTTGVDTIECSIRAAMGEDIDISSFSKPSGFYSYYAVHSYKEGVIDEIVIDPAVEKKHIIDWHMIKKPGDCVKAFTGSNTGLGVLIMRFDSMEQMLHMMDHSDEWINVKILRGGGYSLLSKIKAYRAPERRWAA